MKYTPCTINDAEYSIPLYQRLFEWGSENVAQLLDDLQSAFEKYIHISSSTISEIDPTEGDYYIGMLTSTVADKSGEKLYLVDGQQRFTVMTLIGCVMQSNARDSWRKFLLYREKPRLSFISRKSDELYLIKLINQEFDYEGELVNYKMKEAIKTVRDHMDKFQGDKEAFANYIYNHLSFFISELPEKYGVQELNKYFERMNSSGKDLEHHEILKVKILSKLDGNVSLYMQLWNKIADVDTILLRKKDYQQESEAEYNSRKNKVLMSSLADIEASPELINNLKDEDNKDALPIKNIGIRNKKPQDFSNNHFNGSKSVLRFPQLLLLTLFLYLKNKKGDEFSPKLEDFFNQNKLLETFQKHLPFEGVSVNKECLKEFFEHLLHYRVAMDVCFVRSLEYGYSLDMNLPEDNKDLRELMMFESFLYVSSSNLTYYRWFGWLMAYVMNNKRIPNAKELFLELKKQTDSLNKLPKYSKLHFGKEIKYWFWRLDFYIWQHRYELFKSEEDASYLDIAENYVFIRNRSIEHIAPQHPKTESKLQWSESEDDNALLNSFGNLVMISQSLNSALSNSSYEEKKAHVESYFNSVNGTIESLKLLMVYKDFSTCWSKDNIPLHGEKMYSFLKNDITPDVE
ncbi:MAG: DUF262 domain-containing HNH endonuclease family protein [Bacteroidales bacterium]|nr:DUF262 domain-containing HNH endonuclease family protein [Bacteroidales bacterium]